MGWWSLVGRPVGPHWGGAGGATAVSPQVVCGYGSQDSLPFRTIKEGELFFPEDREVNLVELALATNIPKGCAETAVRGEGPTPGTHQAPRAAHGAPMAALPPFQFTSPTWMEKATWSRRELVRGHGGSDVILGVGLVLPVEVMDLEVEPP